MLMLILRPWTIVLGFPSHLQEMPARPKPACTMQSLQTRPPQPNLAQRNNHHVLHAVSRFPSLTSFCGGISTGRMLTIEDCVSRETNQCLHSSMKCMSVVSTELRVGAFQGWVSHGLWLLKSMQCVERSAPFVLDPHHLLVTSESTYPFLWFFWEL